MAALGAVRLSLIDGPGKVVFGKAALGFYGLAPGYAPLGGRMPTAARTRPWHARLLGPLASSKLLAGPVPNSLATERGRSVRSFYAASEATPAARAPSLLQLENMPWCQLAVDSYHAPPRIDRGAMAPA